MSSLRIITAAADAIPIGELRLHLRVDHTDEDVVIMGYQAAAMRLVGEATGLPVGQTRYTLGLDRFPAGAEPILLPRPRLATLHELRYTDANGEAQTLTTARTNPHATPSQVVPAWGESWPATYDVPNAVEIDFTAGDLVVNPVLVQMVRLLVGEWYEHRENVATVSLSTLPTGFDRLAKAVRFRSVPLSRFLEAH